MCEIAGCFCVYNSKSSLGNIQQHLENPLLCDPQRENRLDFHGLPVVVVLGHNPDADERTLALLREGGQLVADRCVSVVLYIIVELSVRLCSTVNKRCLLTSLTLVSNVE